MALALSELVVTKTKEELRDQLLDALKGRGIVRHEGFGVGRVSISGTPTNDYEVIILVIAGGAKSAATFQYSLDNGSTYSTTQVMSSSLLLPATGVTVAFDDGPAGALSPFLAGEKYRFTLRARQFPVTAWQPGSTPLTQVEVDAEVLADLTNSRAILASSGFVDLNAGEWLSLLAEQYFNLPRRLGTQTTGTVTLTDTTNSGPLTVNVGDLWFQAANGLRYRNTTAGVIPAGGTLDVQVIAEQIGAAYNVPGSNITTMITPLAGVTVNNASNWTISQGTDDETDLELRTRLKLRWTGQGLGGTTDYYKNLAFAADPSVKRVLVKVGATAGTVEIYLAGSAAPVSAPVVTAVQSYISPRTPLAVTPVVAAAGSTAVTVTATVHYATGNLAAAQASILTNLTAYFQNIAIGESVPRSDIVAAINDAAYVKYIEIPTLVPAADVTVPATNVAVLNSIVFGSWTFIAE